MTQQIKDLRDHFEARFAGLEKWLERVTTAVERQAENRDRLIILETKYEMLEAQHLENKTSIAALAEKQGTAKEQLTKLTAYASIAGALAAALVSAAVKHLF